MDCGNIDTVYVLLSSYSCIPFLFSVAYVNQPKAPVTGVGYHLIATTNICVRRMTGGGGYLRVQWKIG